MPKSLRRYYGLKHLHFITCSCYQRAPGLGRAEFRNLFVKTLRLVRTRYRFALVGYVVMPEHFHLLMSEPAIGNPSVVLQVLKQSVAREILGALRNPRADASAKRLLKQFEPAKNRNLPHPSLREG